MSLSFCVQDILKGSIDESNVVCLITGTKLTNEHEWQRSFEDYSKVYWKNDPQRAREIVARLRKNNRIIQPRTFGFEALPINEGVWRLAEVFK